MLPHNCLKYSSNVLRITNLCHSYYLGTIIVLPIKNQDKLIDVMTVGTLSFEVFLLCFFFNI